MRHLIEPLVLFAVLLPSCGPGAVWSIASPDRAHRIELVDDGNRQWIAIDGQPGPVAARIAPTSVVVSPDGGHLAYVELVGEKARVVRDGCPGPLFDSTGELAFSRDGKHFAYAAETRGRFRVVRDGVPGASRAGVMEATLRFGENGKHLYYVEGGPPFRVVVDEVPGKPYDGLARLSVRNAASGPSYTYLGRRGASTYVVTEHGEVGPFQYVTDVVRAEESGSIAWVVDEGERAVVHRDGAAVDARFVSVHGLTFLPGGKELAYVGIARNNRRSVVRGSRTEGEYDEVSELSFSENGRRFGYAAKRGETWEVVVDGRVVARETFSGPPVFSPDGRRMGRFVTRGRRAYAIVDDRSYALEVAMFGTLAFSSDSRHFALIAGDRERRQLFSFVDGREGPPVDFSELTVATLKSFAGNAPPQSEFSLLLDIARAEAERASGKRGAPLRMGGCPK